jgi:hypothetical protein
VVVYVIDPGYWGCGFVLQILWKRMVMVLTLLIVLLAGSFALIVEGSEGSF